jgi:hypothetical protein
LEHKVVLTQQSLVSSPFIESFEFAFFANDGPKNRRKILIAIKFWKIESPGARVCSGQTVVLDRKEIARR